MDMETTVLLNRLSSKTYVAVRNGKVLAVVSFAHEPDEKDMRGVGRALQEQAWGEERRRGDERALREEERRRETEGTLGAREIKERLAAMGVKVKGRRRKSK